LAWTIVALGVAFWLSLSIDWALEVNVATRAIALVTGAVAAAGVFVWYGVARVMRPLPARHLAILIERANPHLNASLVTAVELTEEAFNENQRQGSFDPNLIQRTMAEAQRGCGAIEFDAIFTTGPLLRAVTAAGCLAVMVFGFSLAAPDALAVWARRNVWLDDAPWPRNTRLTAAGFSDGGVKVARGADFELQVLADASAVVPSVVEVRYRGEQGGVGRAKMIREGDALASGTAAQKYTYTFRSMLSSTELDVVGGDARLRGLRVEVVDSPVLTRVELQCRYPDYLGRSSETLAAAGAITVPRGTSLRLTAEANKQLVRVVLARHQPMGVVNEQSVDTDPQAPAHIQLDLGVADADHTVALTLHDVDGIKSRKPTELILHVADDLPPRVKVHPQGVGSAITTLARVPLDGQIEDDHLLTDARIAYRVDSDQWQHQPMFATNTPDSRRDVDEVFDVSSLRLTAGQQLTLQVEAVDNRALADGPQTSSSEPVRFEIVSRDDLLSMLESRELNLRRRLQALIDDVSRVRDSVAVLGAADAAIRPSPSTDPTESDADGASAVDGIDATSLVRIRLHRARQDSRKSAEETLGIARGIEAIRDELIHNQIDSEDTKERLTEGVALPLTRVGGEMFSALDDRFEQLQTAMDEHGAPGSIQSARGQLDAVLLELRTVLDRMLEMETFNELVDTLRELIDTQEQVQTATQRLRRSSVLDLLGE
jgi:hypothetical protein